MTSSLVLGHPQKCCKVLPGGGNLPSRFACLFRLFLGLQESRENFRGVWRAMDVIPSLFRQEWLLVPGDYFCFLEPQAGQDAISKPPLLKQPLQDFGKKLGIFMDTHFWKRYQSDPKISVYWHLGKAL